MNEGQGRGRTASRRVFVATGLAGLSGLAGCIDDFDESADGGEEPTRDSDTSADDSGENQTDNGDEDQTDDDNDADDDSNGARTLRIGTSSPATTAYVASQGIADVVTETTDGLSVDAQTSSGVEANLEALDSGAVELAFVDNWAASGVHDGTGPVDGFDTELAQVVHCYDLPIFFITGSDDLETLSDIGPETRVSPTPEGSEIAPALEHALDYAVDDYERVSKSYGQQSGAMNEGRLDVGVGTLLNFEIEPGWIQETIGRVTDLRILDVEASTASAWASDERLLSRPVDTDRLEGAETPGEIPAPTFSSGFATRTDLEYDLIYDFLEGMDERRGDLAEKTIVLEYFEDDEFWVRNAHVAVPFHPAAADFYEERGIWRDEFDRA